VFVGWGGGGGGGGGVGISRITKKNNDGNMAEVTTLVHITTKRGRMRKQCTTIN